MDKTLIRYSSSPRRKRFRGVGEQIKKEERDFPCLLNPTETLATQTNLDSLKIVFTVSVGCVFMFAVSLPIYSSCRFIFIRRLPGPLVYLTL